MVEPEWPQLQSMDGQGWHEINRQQALEEIVHGLRLIAADPEAVIEAENADTGDPEGMVLNLVLDAEMVHDEVLGSTLPAAVLTTWSEIVRAFRDMFGDGIPGHGELTVEAFRSGEAWNEQRQRARHALELLGLVRDDRWLLPDVSRSEVRPTRDDGDGVPVLEQRPHRLARWLVHVPARHGFGAYDLGPYLVPGRAELELLLVGRYGEAGGFLDGVTYERVEDELDAAAAERLLVPGEPFARWVRNTAGYHWPDDDVKWHRLVDPHEPGPWVTLCGIDWVSSWEGIVGQRPPGRWCDKCLARYRAAHER